MLLEIRIRTILVLFMLFASRPAVLFAEGQGDPQNQLVLKEGLNYFYNSDFVSAEKKFDEYIALEPDDPAGYWRKVFNLFFEARFEQKTDTPKFEKDKSDRFIGLIDKGIEKADTKIKSDDGKDFYLYVKACLYSIRAGVEFKNSSMFSARSSMITSVALARQSQYQDAKYLIGLTNYKMSERNWLVQQFSGLPNDRAEGLLLIFGAAAQNMGTFADDVWFVVWSIETDKKNEDYYGKTTIQSLFDYLFAKYPHNESLQNYLKNLNKK